VVFCDLVDSTERAARLDPEEWRELVRRYHAAAAAVVGRFGGHVEQYPGDGVLAYFGWPVAHDDDAERALQSGLALHEAIGRMNEQRAATGAAPLGVRVGVHTGPVVVAESGGAFGDAPRPASKRPPSRERC
jgi:class 3 adenylate cyclase